MPAVGELERDMIYSKPLVCANLTLTQGTSLRCLYVLGLSGGHTYKNETRAKGCIHKFRGSKQLCAEVVRNWKSVIHGDATPV